MVIIFQLDFPDIFVNYSGHFLKQVQSRLAYAFDIIKTFLTDQVLAFVFDAFLLLIKIGIKFKVLCLLSLL